MIALLEVLRGLPQKGVGWRIHESKSGVYGSGILVAGRAGSLKNEAIIMSLAV